MAKKRKANSLGLTPRLVEDSQVQSEDEAVDEEAGVPQFAATTSLIIQHGTETFDLSDPVQLQAWKEERRKRFPTKARIAEREAEARRERDERQEEGTSFGGERKGNKGRATNANKTKLGKRRVRLEGRPEKSSKVDELGANRKTLSKPSIMQSQEPSDGLVKPDDETTSSGSSASGSDSDSDSNSKGGSESIPEERATREKSLQDLSRNSSTQLIPYDSSSQRGRQWKRGSDCKHLHEKRSGLGNEANGTTEAPGLSNKKFRRGGSAAKRSKRNGVHVGASGRVSLRQRVSFNIHAHSSFLAHSVGQADIVS